MKLKGSDEPKLYHVKQSNNQMEDEQDNVVVCLDKGVLFIMGTHFKNIDPLVYVSQLHGLYKCLTPCLIISWIEHLAH